MSILALVLIFTVGLGLNRDPPRLWLNLCRNSGSTALLFTILTAFWTLSTINFPILLALGIIILNCGHVIFALFALPINFGLLVVYLAATKSIRLSGRLHSTFFIRAWSSFQLDNFFMGLKTFYISIVIFTGSTIAIQLILKIGQWLGDISLLSFDPFVNGLIATLLVLLTFFLMRLIILKSITPVIKIILWLVKAVLSFLYGGLVVFLFSFALVILYPQYLKPIFGLIGNTSAIQMIRIFIFIVVLILIITAGRFLKSLFYNLRRQLLGNRKYLNMKFETVVWKNLMQSAGTDKQNDLLYRTEHGALYHTSEKIEPLSPQEFLEVLKEIRPMIKEEPALSTYWEKRDQLEEALRQERQG